MKRIRSERGIFLLQVVILVLLLGYMTSMLFRMTLGRHVAVHKVNTTTTTRFLMQAVESQVQACLEGSSFGRTTCSLPSGCLPSTVQDPKTGKIRAVSVRSSGSAPNCRLDMEISD